MPMYGSGFCNLDLQNSNLGQLIHTISLILIILGALWRALDLEEDI